MEESSIKFNCLSCLFYYDLRGIALCNENYSVIGHGVKIDNPVTTLCSNGKFKINLETGEHVIMSCDDLATSSPKNKSEMNVKYEASSNIFKDAYGRFFMLRVLP